MEDIVLWGFLSQLFCFASKFGVESSSSLREAHPPLAISGKVVNRYLLFGFSFHYKHASSRNVNMLDCVPQIHNMTLIKPVFY